MRVRVFFDVSRPVRRSKVVNLPKGGGSVTILYDFERIQKRCYHCQRLTHEKDKCPILIQERQDKAKAWRKKVSEDNQKEEEGKQTFMVTIDKDDPLFGVLNEDQVGVDKATGRRKINPEVLQQMREYILAAEGGEKRIRQERVRKSVSDLDNDPLGQKKFLRLEAAPLIIHEVDKGKGFVFGYSNQNEQNHSREDGSRGSSSWVEKEKGPLRSGSGVGRGDRDSNPTEKGNNFFFDCSTGFSSGFSTASSSGTKKTKLFGRHRPPKKFRRQKSNPVISQIDRGEEGEQQANLESKRKATEAAGNFSKIARRNQPEVVPNGGLPNQ